MKPFEERAKKAFPGLSLRAARVAYWIETYCMIPATADDATLEPFVLLDWQIECIAGIYPGNPNERRIIRRAFISTARKSGKSQLGSALVLVHLMGPEAGNRCDIFCAAASSKDQAGIVFDGAKDMAAALPKILRAHIDILKDRMVWKPRGNTAKALVTKPSSLQGLRPAFWIFDEIAETTNRDLYEALNYAGTQRAGGTLGIIISTRSTRIESIFAQLYDEILATQAAGGGKHWFIKIWSADPALENPFTWDQVLAANPAIGVTPPEEDVRQDLEWAIANPSARSDFKARRLNIESGTLDSLVDPTVWAAAGLPLEPREDLYERMRGHRCVIAIDLGSTRSMTSIAVHWLDVGVVSAVSWMTKGEVKKNSTLHRIDYQKWIDQKRLLLAKKKYTKGMSYEAIAEWIKKLYDMFEVLAFRFDDHDFERLKEALWDLKMRYDREPLKSTLEEFVQGAKSYGEAITEFEDALEAETLKHDNDPVSNLAVNVCQVVSDPTASNPMRKPAKNKQGLPNDAAMAILMAVAKRGIYAKTIPKSPSEEVIKAWEEGDVIDYGGDDLYEDY